MSSGVYELFSVEGKKALVTGGSAGLGRAMAEALVEAGSRVAIVGRSERVFDTAKEIGAIPLQTDLADRAQALALVDRAVEVFGGLDILVNNAGVQRRYPAEEFPLEDWDYVLSVNLDAVWILAQTAGRYMLAQGHGKIINLASANSFFGRALPGLGCLRLRTRSHHPGRRRLLRPIETRITDHASSVRR